MTGSVLPPSDLTAITIQSGGAIFAFSGKNIFMRYLDYTATGGVDMYGWRTMGTIPTPCD